VITAITQRVVVITYRRFGTIYRVLSSRAKNPKSIVLCHPDYVRRSKLNTVESDIKENVRV